MFDESCPPVMRGDLFALLDPDTTERALTPGHISSAARRLVDEVSQGTRAPGAPVLMHCLDQLARLGESTPDPHAAFGQLRVIRQQLVALAGSPSRPLPWSLLRERTMVLPQQRAARLVRVAPCKDALFALTREASPKDAPPELDDLADTPDRPPEDGSALGPAHVPHVEVVYRLFRFGEGASNIRLVMRIVQEPGTFQNVLVAGDGDRVAVLSRDVIGVFDPDGKVALSGRVPMDADPDAGAEVTGIALQGDVLAINLRAARGRPVELALLDLAQKRGFPMGTVGDDAEQVALGPKQAYVVDGLNLLRVPLFGASDEGIAVFRLRPWFAEYPWGPRTLICWSGDRVWVTNGKKIIVLTDDLGIVLAEVTLPEEIVDFDVVDDELTIVTTDVTIAVSQVRVYDVAPA